MVKLESEEEPLGGKTDSPTSRSHGHSQAHSQVQRSGRAHQLHQESRAKHGRGRGGRGHQNQRSQRSVPGGRTEVRSQQIHCRGRSSRGQLEHGHHASTAASSRSVSSARGRGRGPARAAGRRMPDQRHESCPDVMPSNSTSRQKRTSSPQHSRRTRSVGNVYDEEFSAARGGNGGRGPGRGSEGRSHISKGHSGRGHSNALQSNRSFKDMEKEIEALEGQTFGPELHQESRAKHGRGRGGRGHQNQRSQRSVPGGRTEVRSQQMHGHGRSSRCHLEHAHHASTAASSRSVSSARGRGRSFKDIEKEIEALEEQTFGPEEQNGKINASSQKHTNINVYFGHKMGFLQILSLTLNAGLMIYAHLGLSAVILSSQDTAAAILPSLPDDTEMLPSEPSTGQCTLADVDQYVATGGDDGRMPQSDYCSRSYNGGCLLDTVCIEECFQTQYGYSANCTTCFAAIPTCGFQAGCLSPCIVDSSSEACKECNIPCQEEFLKCSGFPSADATAITTSGNVSDATAITNATCNDFDLEAIEPWYVAYYLTFVQSIRDSWDGDAKLLSVIIVIFSGIWPYLKNVILAIVWYLPMRRSIQTSILLWLSRLSKYTLVDVFAVMLILVAVQLQLDFGGVQVVTRAEPRGGIIAFFFATVWEFIQIEVIKVMYEEKVLGASHGKNDVRDEEKADGNNEDVTMDEEPLPVKHLWIPLVLFVLSVGLFVAGAVTNIVTFKTKDTASACTRSYNLVTLGNGLVSEQSLTGNAAAGQTWFLYLCWIVLVLILPMITHCMQLLVLINRTISKGILGQREKAIRYWTSNVWSFATVEVLMIAVFCIEYRFPQLVQKLAGEGATFLEIGVEIDSNLNAGFALLIVYSVIAGITQYTLRVCPPGLGYRKENTEEAYIHD